MKIEPQQSPRSEKMPRLSKFRIQQFALSASSFGVFLIAVFSGCGTKVELSPELAKVQPRYVALLPTTAPEETRKARVEYLEQALISELKSRGYSLLDEELVRRSCMSMPCTKAALLKQYPLDGVFELRIDSISRNNFGVGYYNSISGSLQLTDRAGKELAKIDHSEREKGGVVFDSGQIIQGIIAQVKNFGDESYNHLADRFARTLSLKVPEPSVSADVQEIAPITLGDIETKEVTGEVYEICAMASPQSTTSLLMNKIRTNLREISPGRYCGIYRFASPESSPPQLLIEARSPFGTSARREISITSQPLCSLSGKVRAEKDGPNVALHIDCAQIAEKPAKGRKAETRIECLDNGFTCAAEKVYVYRSTSEAGPYQKIAEVKQLSWMEKLQAPVFYEVVAVGKSGNISNPVTPVGTESLGR